MSLPATQQFLQFETVRDGVLILKNGDMRAILMVSAMNFALKSQDEQEAIIYAFQNFLNSLDFDFQIFVHSRRMNIKRYLASLEEIHAREDNELMRVQIEEYTEFIRKFVEEVNVMTKTFYVTVPFSLQAAKAKESGLGALGGFFSGGGKAKQVTIDPAKFQYWRNELFQRAEFIIQGLHAVGLRATLLSTPEITELMWSLHNPEKADIEDAPNISTDTLAQELT